ncbi:hypothetical protein [Streptomyces marianii]|uniref:Aminoglycoside phosphotransferase n=1 Tax=Streptomyces marianii TaxID=1817406 RepID=A0A5R9DZJ3_9ACTN|nr:hypothetical protein [Streptomyces marianii]TLQ42239.1 hypothetical protein FEF34_02435 [Streptomyces marianii]
MTTSTWADLPTTVRLRLEDDLKPIGPPSLVADDFTPGLRVRFPTDDGTVFVKAIRSDSGPAASYRTEAAVSKVLPAGISPQLLISLECDGWVALAFHFHAGRHADLTPGSPDLQPVVDAVGRLHVPLTPNPLPGAPHITTNPVLQEADHRRFPGDTLLHCDLGAKNLVIAEDGQIRIIRWARPHRGPAWIDTAFLIPQLILAGHTAQEAEKWVDQVPAYQQADKAAINLFAAALTGYWLSRAPQPPSNRAHSRDRIIDAARAWVRHRSFV